MLAQNIFGGADLIMLSGGDSASDGRVECGAERMVESLARIG